MTHKVADKRSIWRAPYRPLFFLAGLWALVSPMVWLLPEQDAPERVTWHSRELLFGMAGAAAGGYLLTALPAWTKRGPVTSAVTLVATCLWCAARLTGALTGHLPFIAAAIGVSAYFAFLTVVLTHGVVASRAWDRCWAPFGTGALGISALANIGAGPGPTPTVYALLVVLIGGRAVPALTRSWLDRTAGGRPFCDRRKMSHLAIVGILAAAFLDRAWPTMSSGYVLVFSGALLLLQMMGWQSLRTARYPALFILHVAFAWMPAALVLSGLSAIFPSRVPPDVALHALTIGAMGTMMAALMTRPAMDRHGETLILSRSMACAFSLVSLSALLRVFGAWVGQTHFDPVAAAAICWIAAWALFLADYIPAMIGPVPRPVFSAAINRI
ncbi:NnrS family protein [Ensifer sp. NBAIM29]|nr:NnrS family protein [Ensifer sp. NBAIM29]